jgi:uncharacterized membrane protein
VTNDAAAASDGDGDDERHGPKGHRGPAQHSLARAGFIEYDRVLFFSDAVFAIAITLLAIDLRAPAATFVAAHHLSTSDVLSSAGPSLIGFGISFAVIGVFWLGHHRIFRYITALDRPLIGLNLFFLGTIAFLPYPTELLSSTASNHGGAEIFYAICASVAGLAEGAIWLYATTIRPALADPSAAKVRLTFSLRIARVPAVFLASIPVAVVAPKVAPFLWILIWVSGIAIRRFVPLPDEPEPIGEQIDGQ